MHYAYILRSLSDADKLYYGSTADLKNDWLHTTREEIFPPSLFDLGRLLGMQDFPINKQLVISRSISKRHPAKHLPKSVYSMPMNHDSFTWVE